LVAIECLHENPDNPRTEFPQADLEELAVNIGQHGILQAIVVHPADAQGIYRIHFGAKRLRAAKQLGMTHVPIIIRAAEADSYAQVAENQKRHGLSALDLARFIAKQVDTGDSHATIAQKDGDGSNHHHPPSDAAVAVTRARCRDEIVPLHLAKNFVRIEQVARCST
jgi:ParB family chromosome partitioning protein